MLRKLCALLGKELFSRTPDVSSIISLSPVTAFVETSSHSHKLALLLRVTKLAVKPDGPRKLNLKTIHTLQTIFKTISLPYRCPFFEVV